MFDREFYPTPFKVAYDIAGDYRGRVTSVLDPSAGKGDLLKPFGRWTRRLYGIEQNLELCEILRGMHVMVLGHDFLEYHGEHFFDLVVMNPPYSVCEKHFLHAWEVCRSNDIVAILPKRVVEGRTSMGETVRRIVEDNGEYVDLGSPFSALDSERKTNVHVVKVTVHKPESNAHIFDFQPRAEVKTDLSEIKNSVATGLVLRDRVGQLVGQYRESVEGIKDLVKAAHRIRGAVGSQVSSFQLFDMMKSCVGEDDPGTAYNILVDAIQGGFWEALFKEGEFAKYMTRTTRRDFDTFRSAHTMMAFSEENILSVMETLVMSNHAIFEQNIIAVFDDLTEYHKHNRIYPEGWVTNKSWKIGRKFILPGVVEYKAPWGMSLHYNYRTDTLRDIDIAMCTITGKDPDEIVTIGKAIEYGCKTGDWPVESTFFSIRCYQKGTAHFVFLEEDVWDDFNRIACKGKKWLPE